MLPGGWRRKRDLDNYAMVLMLKIHPQPVSRGETPGFIQKDKFTVKVRVEGDDRGLGHEGGGSGFVDRPSRAKPSERWRRNAVEFEAQTVFASTVAI